MSLHRQSRKASVCWTVIFWALGGLATWCLSSFSDSSVACLAQFLLWLNLWALVSVIPVSVCFVAVLLWMKRCRPNEPLLVEPPRAGSILLWLLVVVAASVVVGNYLVASNVGHQLALLVYAAVGASVPRVLPRLVAFVSVETLYFTSQLVCLAVCVGALLQMLTNRVRLSWNIKVATARYPWDEEQWAIFTTLCRHLSLRRLPEVVQCDNDDTDSPYVYGIVRPTVVFPTRLHTTLPFPEAFGVLMAHELAHVKHREGVIRFLLESTSVLFPLPSWLLLQPTIPFLENWAETAADTTAARCGIDVELIKRLHQDYQERIILPQLGKDATDEDLLGNLRNPKSYYQVSRWWSEVTASAALFRFVISIPVGLVAAVLLHVVPQPQPGGLDSALSKQDSHHLSTKSSRSTPQQPIEVGDSTDSVQLVAPESFAISLYALFDSAPQACCLLSIDPIPPVNTNSTYDEVPNERRLNLRMPQRTVRFWFLPFGIISTADVGEDNLMVQLSASTGADQSGTVGTVIQLDSCGSSDVDGGPLIYSGSLISIPATITATLQNPTSVTMSLVWDQVRNSMVLPVVYDAPPSSASATVYILGPNNLPMANTGSDNSWATDTTFIVAGGPSSVFYDDRSADLVGFRAGTVMGQWVTQDGSLALEQRTLLDCGAYGPADRCLYVNIDTARNDYEIGNWLGSFGLAEDVAVIEAIGVGNFNGDRRSDIIVFLSFSEQWYLYGSNRQWQDSHLDVHVDSLGMLAKGHTYLLQATSYKRELAVLRELIYHDATRTIREVGVLGSVRTLVRLDGHIIQPPTVSTIAPASANEKESEYSVPFAFDWLSLVAYLLVLPWFHSCVQLQQRLRKTCILGRD